MHLLHKKDDNASMTYTNQPIKCCICRCWCSLVRSMNRLPSNGMRLHALVVLLVLPPVCQAEALRSPEVALPPVVASAAEGRELRSAWLLAVRLGHEAEMAAIGGKESHARELGQQSLALWNRIQASYLVGSRGSVSGKARSDSVSKVVAQVLESKSRIYGEILGDQETARLELAEAVAWAPDDEALKKRLTRAIAKAEGRAEEISASSAVTLPKTYSPPLAPLPPVIGVAEEITTDKPDTK
jgi:hypothetical protein